MIVALIEELSIVDVFQRGVPNNECIVISVKETLNLGQYGVMLGVRGPAANSGFPIKDNLFWFGDAVVNGGDWIFLYTGAGDTKVNQIPNTPHHIYSLHWGRATTIFTAQEIVPILFRIDAVAVYTETAPAALSKQEQG